MSANVAEMRYRLLVQQAADGQLNHLIPEIRQLLDDFFAKSDAGKDDRKKWKLEHKQLSNLFGVCGETDSVEAAIGFIEYQIGRDKSGENWAWEGFGETLKKKLRALQGNAKGILGQAIQESGHASDDPARVREVERVWMELVRLYAGHLRRYFVYKKPEKGG